MYKQLISGLIITLSSYSHASPEASLVQLGALLSDNNPSVERRLSIYLNDRSGYFRAHENNLWERGIENPRGITTEIALIDSLIESGSLVYADFAMEADQVMIMLDKAYGNTLSEQACFRNLIRAYSELGPMNVIANFLYNEDIGPMPMNCITSSGYMLASIDEGSDAYAFVLVERSDNDLFSRLASDANVKVKIH